MISYRCNGGRLGENISYLYGLFKFAKNNALDFKNIKIDFKYKNIPCSVDDKPQSVFLDNIDMFENVNYIFDNSFDYSVYNRISLYGKYDIANFYNFYILNNIDRTSNIMFSDYWSLCDYWVNKNGVDIQLLKYICFPNHIYKKLYKKYKDILFNSLSIHVRRGDFLCIDDKSLVNKDIRDRYNVYFTSDKKLYTKNDILKVIEEKIKQYNNILLFSDDIKWCQDNFDIYKNVYCIRNKKSYEDMLLMSMCTDVLPNPGSFFSKISTILNKFSNYEKKNT